MKRLGTFLILFSVFSLVILFLPFLLTFLPHKNPSTAGYSYTIAIPKIHAVAPIITSVDPWNRSAYTSALRLGVAQAKGTALPGEHGTIYLFAHSSENPWEMLSTNVPFLRLGELKSGDVIFVSAHSRQLRYVVFSKKIVSASDVSVLTKKEEDELILQTCWPIGTDWQRLLVYAKPSNSFPQAYKD
jgi:LPXTG-site transpeptidase (sortase) family protein